MRTSAEQLAFFKGLINFLPIQHKEDYKHPDVTVKHLTHTFAEAMLAAHGIPCLRHSVDFSMVSQIIFALRPDITPVQHDREVRLRMREVFDLGNEDTYAVGSLQPVEWQQWDMGPEGYSRRVTDRILGPQEPRYHRYFRFGYAGIPAPSLLLEVGIETHSWNELPQMCAQILASPEDALMYHEKANTVITDLYNNAVKLTKDEGFLETARKERKRRNGY